MKKAFKQNGTSAFGWIAIIAIVSVISLSMVGCGDDDRDNPVDPGGNGGNRIIITGVPANLLVDNARYIFISSLINNEDIVAMGDETISGNSIIYDTYTLTLEPWIGRGSYYISIILVGDYYIYSNGTETQQKYNFSSATSTIPFNKFARLY
jgi:hypothetical protein